MAAKIFIIPTNHAVLVNGSRGLEAGIYGISRVVNEKAQPRERPSFVAETH